jgi:hypothetical protein
MNGVLNLLAFVALVVVGTSYLFSGWTLSGGFLLGLGILSLILGVWDIWIYRRNLPAVAAEKALKQVPTTKELAAPHTELAPPLSIAESTTRKLEVDD